MAVIYRYIVWLILTLLAFCTYLQLIKPAKVRAEISAKLDDRTQKIGSTISTLRKHDGYMFLLKRGFRLGKNFKIEANNTASEF
jgi:hypothetical protein